MRRSRKRHSVHRVDLTVRYSGRPAIFGTHGAASGALNDRVTAADLRPSGTSLSLGFSVGCTACDRSRLDQIRLEARCPHTDVSYLRMAALQRGPLVLASTRPLRLGARERVGAFVRACLFFRDFADVLVARPRTARTAAHGLWK